MSYPTTLHTCVQCQVVFRGKPDQRCCSRSCAARYGNAQRAAGAPARVKAPKAPGELHPSGDTRVCANPTCGAVFARKRREAPSRWITRAFCSSVCAGRVNPGRPAGSRTKRPAPAVAVVPVAAPVVVRPTWRPVGFVLRPGDAGYDERQEQAS